MVVSGSAFVEEQSVGKGDQRVGISN